MPYHCAKAVCATFCHNISGALIPIFGPDFPSLCTPSEAPEYSRMIIDPAIVAQSTRDAEHYRRLYSNSITSSANNGRASPPRDRRPVFRTPYDDPRQNHHHNHHQHHQHHQHHIPRRHQGLKPFVAPPGCDSPYITDTDSSIPPAAVPDRSSMSHHRERLFPYSPVIPPPPIVPSSSSTTSLRPTSSGWTPANVVLPHHHHHYNALGPSPWLSAVPRFTTPDHLPPYPPSSHPIQQQTRQPQPQVWRGASKRSAEHVEADYYDNARGNGNAAPTAVTTGSNGSGSSSNGSTTRTPTLITGPNPNTSHHPSTLPPPQDIIPNGNGDGNGEYTAHKPTILGADKNAALLLMNLSVRDSRCNNNNNNHRCGGLVTSETNSPRDGAFPRIKRVRANSM